MARVTLNVAKMLLEVMLSSIIILHVTSTLTVKFDGVDFAVDYFKYRKVKLVCLLTCGQDFSWSLKFSKAAFNNTMMMSEVKMDNIDTDHHSLYRCLHYELNSVGVLLDGNCEESRLAVYMASENLSYSAQHKWLIIENDRADFKNHSISDVENKHMAMYNRDNATITKLLNKLNISVDADINVGSRDDFDCYTLYNVFNFGKLQGGNLVINKIGYWNSVNGLEFESNPNEYKYYQRWNFQNLIMRMILVASPAPRNFSLNLLSGLKPIPGVATITQACGALLCLIADMHNFRYNHTITDRWVGSYDKNATRVVANSLYFREQDISPLIRYVPAIQRKVDVSVVPLQKIETRFYYRIPNTGPGNFENQFLRPLSPLAWWSVVGISVLSAFLLLLSARLEERPSSFEYAIFSIIALICQQLCRQNASQRDVLYLPTSASNKFMKFLGIGQRFALFIIVFKNMLIYRGWLYFTVYEDNDDGRIKRLSSARKILILVSGVSCVLIYNYYTSSVVSWLLNGPPPSIRTLWELLESPLELIFEDIGYTRSWLQTPNYYYNKRNALVEDELRRKKVFNKNKDDPLLVPLIQGIKMVQNGGYAYHVEVSSANALISRTFDQDELCELGFLTAMEKTPLFASIPKDSPFKEFITWSLMRLFERGFVSYIQARTASLEVKCEGSSPRALTLGGAAPAFILLVSGYLLATVIMLSERFIFKMKKVHQS